MRDRRRKRPAAPSGAYSAQRTTATVREPEPKAERPHQQEVESPAVMTWEYDTKERRFTFVSARGESFLGYTRERWMAEFALQDLIHPDDLETVANRAGKGIESLEYRLIAADGRIVEVRDFTREIAAADGTMKIVGVCWEISERKRTAEAVRVGDETDRRRTAGQPTNQNDYGLSSREIEVVRLVASGMADKEIALALRIRPKTVGKHLENILAKMDCSSRTEVGVRSVKEGLTG